MAQYTDHEEEARRHLADAIAAAGFKPASQIPHPDDESQPAWGPHGQGCLCENDELPGPAGHASLPEAISAALAAGARIEVLMPFVTRSGRAFIGAVPLARRPELN